MADGRKDEARTGASSLRIPFVTTTPLHDLGNAFLLLPVWWLLGVEQFIWPVVLLWIAAKQLVIRDFQISLVPAAKWLLAFLAVQLLSALFIVEGSRVFTFARNLSTYVSALLILVVVTNASASPRMLSGLLWKALVGLGAGVVLGLAALGGLWTPTFTSPVGMILPAWVADSAYGGPIVERSLGGYRWFLLFGEYYRLTSFFLFPTFYATALVIMVPMALFLTSTADRLVVRVIGTALIVAMLVNLLATTGRIAILGGIIGGAYFVFQGARRKEFALLVGCGIVVICGVLLLNQPKALQETVDTAIMARGAPIQRMAVYQATIEGLTERPLLGWGTERDVVGIRYPAGSHSYYLGVLYRHGILGFSVFLGLLWAIWRGTSPTMASDPIAGRDPWAGRLLQFGRWTLVAMLINGTTDVLDLDASTMAILWLVIAVLFAAKLGTNQEARSESA